MESLLPVVGGVVFGSKKEEEASGGEGGPRRWRCVCVCIHSVRRGEAQHRNETTMRGGIRAVQYTVRGLLGELEGGRGGGGGPSSDIAQLGLLRYR